MPKGAFLHPDFVEEVVEELLSSDIIGKEKIALLKNDSFSIVDPNMVMDIRHKEVKKESLIDFTNEDIKVSETANRALLKSCLKPVANMKDLKTIDKEIAFTKKNLLAFQNQLVKKHESFLNSIVNLEEQEREQTLTSPLIVNLNEEEAKRYFNLHLDNLEKRGVQNFSRRQANVWKPFETKSSPVINIITNLKDFDKNPSSVLYDEEELEMLSMLKMDSIHITGKTLLNLSAEREECTNTVPSNTPSLYPYEPCSIKEVEIEEMGQTKDEIARDVIQKWKCFTTKKKIKSYEEEKVRRTNIELSKKVFKKWISFVNQIKAKKEEDILIHNYLRKSKVSHVSKKKPIEIRKQTFRKCLELQKKNLDHCIDLFPIVDTCPQKINSESLSSIKNAQKNSDSKNAKLASDITSSRLCEEAKMNIKTIKPEEVGLVNDEQSNHQKRFVAVNDVEVQKSNRTLSKLEKSKTHQEPLTNRFAAQEKIIAQQLEVIEEQKKLIFDLHAHNLQVQSKLTLQLAESELAKARCNKNLKPIAERAPEAKKQLNNIIKLDEKSDQLCKNMLERQKHCKMLAERTKLRKMRIAEEKAKLKLEQEEKERQEKEEEKRHRILKIKIEQKLAREKADKHLAYKWHMEELSNKAIHHHNQHLLRQTFKALKKVSLETYLKSNECSKIYERSLLIRVVVSWWSVVRESIESKFEMAQKFYCTKLVDRAWNTWRREHQEYRIKVQVSEDMFALKLQERMLRRWTAFAAKQYLQTCCKMEMADRLHRRQVLRHVFCHWRDLPKLLFAERERDQRRRAWRQAVQELIPDFTPLES